MEKAVAQFIIKNGQEVVVDNFDGNFIESGLTIYEVIRIMDGVPLFWEEHSERLKQSVVKAGVILTDNDDKIYENLLHLINLNKLESGNIKIAYNYSADKNNPDSYYYFIPHSYPSSDDYSQGVDTILYYAKRNNPTAKIFDTDLRNNIDKIIKSQHVYEAILVDNENRIQEGSRSNIFTLRNNVICTAPATTVLSGITRGMVISLIKSLNFEFEEAYIKTDDIPFLDGMFISGTSPQILPIKKVNDIELNSASNPMVQRLIRAYDELVKDYLAEKQNSKK